MLVLAAGRPPSSCLLPPAKKRSEDGKARQCWKGREVGQEKEHRLSRREAGGLGGIRGLVPAAGRLLALCSRRDRGYRLG